VTAPVHEEHARVVPSVAEKAPARAPLKEAVVPLMGAATKPLPAEELPARVTV